MESDEDLYELVTVKTKDRFHHIPPPPLLLITKNNNTRSPYASSSHPSLMRSSDCERSNAGGKMMLATLDWRIRLVYDHEEQQHGLLTSATTASMLLQRKSTTGIWSIPAHDDSGKVAAEAASGYDHLIEPIKATR